ncbi:MAG: hypothetical protein KAS91_00630 [Candidatus Pacebacteria bacterium]|nr:hypothetical protein [Candidatus Paceibacterota bacterium]
MRDVNRCPIYWKLQKEAIPCSYPNVNKCGRIGGSFLCKHRIAEIGKKNCLKEVSELKDYAKHCK